MASRYHHGDLKRALTEAGLELLNLGGVEAVSIRAAARAVGVSHAAPMRHFPDLPSFLAAIATVGYSQLASAMEAAKAAQATTLEALRATGLAYVAFAVDRPNLFRALTHPLVGPKTEHPDLAEASTRAFAVLSDAIAAAQDDGSLPEGDLATVALTAWSTVHGLATLVVDDQLRAKGYGDPPLRLAEKVLLQIRLGFGVPGAAVPGAAVQKSGT